MIFSQIYLEDVEDERFPRVSAPATKKQWTTREFALNEQDPGVGPARCLLPI